MTHTPEELAMADRIAWEQWPSSHDYAERDAARDAALLAIQATTEAQSGVRESAFKAGWDACWCRRADAPFESDGGRDTAYRKFTDRLKGGPDARR